MYIGIGILVILGMFVGVTYNGLVSGENKIKNSWSQIEVQLKRKADLIPAMTEVVKGYASHEKETFEDVAGFRSRLNTVATPQDVEKTNADMTGIFGRLMAIAENYPELKADKNFMDLQQELARTEDKIAFSRQFYNDVVLVYNNRVRMFPSNMIAQAFRFAEHPYFDA